MANPQEIQNMIATGIAESTVKVYDPMNDGQHLEALVISNAFEGKSRIARHRMVYDALGDAFDGALHALKLKTQTPEENNAA